MKRVMMILGLLVLLYLWKSVLAPWLDDVIYRSLRRNEIETQVEIGDAGERCLAGFLCDSGTCLVDEGMWIGSGYCSAERKPEGCNAEVHFGVFGTWSCSD